MQKKGYSTSADYFTVEKYRRLVERSRVPEFRELMRNEVTVLSRIEGSRERTFVDLGAGYGRLLPTLSRLGGNVVGIELDHEMYRALRRRARTRKNCTAIEGNMVDAERLLQGVEVCRPVVSLTHNGLGGIKDASEREVLAVMKRIASMNDGVVVLSLSCQEGLADYGVRFYTSLAEMTGVPDMKKTDFARGVMVSTTGYVVKWWTPEERREIKEFFGGRVLDEIATKNYDVFAIAPAQETR